MAVSHCRPCVRVCDLMSPCFKDSRLRATLITLCNLIILLTIFFSKLGFRTSIYDFEGHILSPPKQSVHTWVLSEPSVCPSWHISLSGSYDCLSRTRWREMAEPRDEARMRPQNHDPTKAGPSSWSPGSSGRQPWSGSGQADVWGDLLPCVFWIPLLHVTLLCVLAPCFSLEDFPSSVLHVAGNPVDCSSPSPPPPLPRASGPHPSSPSLLPGPAWLLSLLPSTRWTTASTALHPLLNSLLLLDLPPP